MSTSGKKSQGRKQIEKKKISNESHLVVTFSKRRYRLFKKSSELNTLCGTEIALIVFSPGGKVFSFGHPNVEVVIERYLSQAMPQPSKNILYLEALRSTKLRELNNKLSLINNELDACKNHDKELNHMLNEAQTQISWTRQIEDMDMDHFFLRPTKPVEWWEGSDILGGKDEIAKGTWLACSREGRVAFLTNVLEDHTLPEAKSRGDLPVSFLKSKKHPQEFAESLKTEAHYYNGFNLIVADISSKSMVYITNRPKKQSMTIEEVSPGLHVLSNASLDSPWHKALRLEVGFKKQLAKYGVGEIPVKEVIHKLMMDRTKAEETRLPHICSLDWEYNLSPVFVEVETPMGRYGTRSSAALIVRWNGEVNFFEAYLDGGVWKEHVINFHIQNLKLVKCM